MGNSRPNTLIHLHFDDLLSFELRATAVDSFKFSVCESINNLAFVRSSILLASQAQPLVESCVQAFGSFSTPYRIEVGFNGSVINPSMLTQRKIKLVMGNHCDSAVSSGVIDVVGKWWNFEVVLF